MTEKNQPELVSFLYNLARQFKPFIALIKDLANILFKVKTK